MSIPRDLKVDDPRPRHGQDQRRLRARRAEAHASRRSSDALRTSRSTTSSTSTSAASATRSTGSAASTSTSTARYFNDNNPPFGGGGNYATIDVKPGYQKLCGQDALDYVRYRHFDTDFVRAARQQDFLRQAKDQFGARQALRRPQGAAADLRPLHADRHPLDARDPAAAQARVRVLASTRSSEVHFRGGDQRDPTYVDDHARTSLERDARRVPQRRGARRARARRDDRAKHAAARAHAAASSPPG